MSGSVIVPGIHQQINKVLFLSHNLVGVGGRITNKISGSDINFKNGRGKHSKRKENDGSRCFFRLCGQECLFEKVTLEQRPKAS